MDLEGVFGQARLLRSGPSGSDGRTAELDGALGQLVGMLQDCVHQLVEELVERDEARSFDVPVRLLGLERKVEGIGELLIEKLNRSRANLFG
jgi:hypothetical protein